MSMGSKMQVSVDSLAWTFWSNARVLLCQHTLNSAQASSRRCANFNIHGVLVMSGSNKDNSGQISTTDI